MVQSNKDKLNVQIISIKNVFFFTILLLFTINLIPTVLNLIYSTCYLTFNIIYYSIYVILAIPILIIWLYIFCQLEELFNCIIDTFKTIFNNLVIIINNSISKNKIKYDTDLGYKGPFKKSTMININNILKINKTVEREIIVID
ncbi:hypothetical protein ACTA71_010331 [Dictyostelium dimigraforme]